MLLEQILSPKQSNSNNFPLLTLINRIDLLRPPKEHTVFILISKKMAEYIFLNIKSVLKKLTEEITNFLLEYLNSNCS